MRHRHLKGTRAESAAVESDDQDNLGASAASETYPVIFKSIQWQDKPVLNLKSQLMLIEAILMNAILRMNVADRFCCNTYRGCSTAAKAVTPICAELCCMQHGWQG